LALAVSLSRFTSSVGGGSAFYVRPHSHHHKTKQKKQMKNTIITGIIAATILIAGSSSSVAQTQERAIVTKAKSIVLPEFKLDGVTLAEAVRQLSVAAKQSYPSNGINFMLTEPAKTAASPKITLALKKVTVAEAAERIAKEAGVRVTARDFAFVFDAKTDKP
jgi:hypothetical protein